MWLQPGQKSLTVHAPIANKNDDKTCQSPNLPQSRKQTTLNHSHPGRTPSNSDHRLPFRLSIDTTGVLWTKFSDGIGTPCRVSALHHVQPRPKFPNKDIYMLIYVGICPVFVPTKEQRFTVFVYDLCEPTLYLTIYLLSYDKSEPSGSKYYNLPKNPCSTRINSSAAAYHA